MGTPVHDDGKDIYVDVEVDVDGFLYIKAHDGQGQIVGIPKMTPFEASMLARDLAIAADKADRL